MILYVWLCLLILECARLLDLENSEYIANEIWRHEDKLMAVSNGSQFLRECNLMQMMICCGVSEKSTNGGKMWKFKQHVCAILNAET